MFKKAFPYDDGVIFYFDKFDNKHVAKGGGLAWRLNIPGLIHSRSGVALKNGSIGSYQKYAIFSELVEDDIDYYLDTRNPDVIEVFRKQCEKEYVEKFKIISNVTILEKYSSGSWEHAFDIPCYQLKLKEILNFYRTIYVYD